MKEEKDKSEIIISQAQQHTEDQDLPTENLLHFHLS